MRGGATSQPFCRAWVLGCQDIDQGPRAGRPLDAETGWEVPMHENEPAQARGPLPAREWGRTAKQTGFGEKAWCNHNGTLPSELSIPDVIAIMWRLPLNEYSGILALLATHFVVYEYQAISSHNGMFRLPHAQHGPPQGSA
ncbi:uncharacterized protein TrAtP1_002116 [Trichoderma atroviride]|uniref:uncharacterized protein n=1 Tax=Hypocrea atroviridis TaxID=63577 RepID=UPI00331BD3C9|nr:hypothetical protein TrAtP1_002116 [Trichoderma atroviride]